MTDKNETPYSKLQTLLEYLYSKFE